MGGLIQETTLLSSMRGAVFAQVLGNLGLTTSTVMKQF